MTTNCHQGGFEIPPLNQHPIRASLTARDITSDGGGLLLQESYGASRCGLRLMPYALDWITREPLRREWFLEQRSGTCRLMESFAQTNCHFTNGEEVDWLIGTCH